MVATRRNAPKEPEIDMADPELALRKKPVRKATARTKQVESASAPETQMARATRGRRAAASPMPDESVGEESAAEPELPMRAKPTRRVGRPAKAREERAPPVVEEPTTAKKATRATRTAVIRSKKTEVRKDEESAQPQVEEPKPTARRTRATAPAAKSQPLSPKKITQVSKPQTRNVKAAPAKAKAAKPALSTRTTRKRAVSDENEEVPTLTATNNEEDDLVLLASTPIKRSSPARPTSVKKITEVEDGNVMSSRPTTPSDSPAPSFDVLQDENEYHKPGKTASATGESEDEDESGEEGASEDELCGPKTPMKRTSPGAEARYIQSVQRTIRRADAQISAGTPQNEPLLRRKVAATPRTQQAPSKRAAPASEVRPMTVARGADRAMVFKQLQSLSPAAENAHILESEGDESTAVHDVSTISEDEASAPVLTLQSSPVSSTVEAPELHMPEDVFDEETTILDEVAPNVEVEDPNDTILIHEAETDQEDHVEAAAQQTIEAEDTMLVDDAEDESLIQASMTAEDEEEPAAPVAASRSPETIPWGNLRQDVTIPFNFDAHFANVTLGPGARHVDLDAEEISVLSAESEERQATASANIADGLESMNALPVHEPETPARHDVTVNLNDFIDLAGLSEPTQAIELPKPGSEEDVLEAASSGLDADDHGTNVPESEVVSDSHLGLSDDLEGALEKSESCKERLVDIVDTEPEEADEVTLPIRPQCTASEDEEGESAIVDEEHTPVPHYALPTFAFDVRRKSLPAVSSLRTPVRLGSRPFTSDGASMPRLANPFINARWSRSRGNSTAETHNGTPSRQHSKTLPEAASPVSNRIAPRTPQLGLPERYPTLGARRTYEEHAKTAMTTRFRTPVQTSVQRPVSAQKPSASAVTPRASTLRARPVSKPSTPAANTPTGASSVASSPVATPSERFPRLRARETYEDHSKTVAGPTRFRTPAQSPAKRPDTVQKHGSLRKVAFKNSTPRMSSHTPMKTPLKPAAMTPGMEPMTPHPSAPLRGVVAMVEIFTNEGASASAPFIAQLQRLGAKTTKVWSDRVTHVVFKDGSPTTLQRVRLHNKEVKELGNAPLIYCVNSRWVSACDDQGRRVSESDEDFAVDLDEVPRGGRRRRKSMEPAALVNVSGSIFRNRRSSVGRSSLGRSPLQFDSPVKRPEPEIATPKPAGLVAGPEDEDKENSGADDLSSPVTPAYLAAPDQLVQQTAPVNKMRKLGMKAADRAKNRRLTYFPSMA